MGFTQKRETKVSSGGVEEDGLATDDAGELGIGELDTVLETGMLEETTKETEAGVLDSMLETGKLEGAAGDGGALDGALDTEGLEGAAELGVMLALEMGALEDVTKETDGGSEETNATLLAETLGTALETDADADGRSGTGLLGRQRLAEATATRAVK